MERRQLDDSLRYALVSGKRVLENAGLGGDNLNKVCLLEMVIEG